MAVLPINQKEVSLYPPECLHAALSVSSPLGSGHLRSAAICVLHLPHCASYLTMTIRFDTSPTTLDLQQGQVRSTGCQSGVLDFSLLRCHHLRVMIFAFPINICAKPVHKRSHTGTQSSMHLCNSAHNAGASVLQSRSDVVVVCNYVVL